MAGESPEQVIFALCEDGNLFARLADLRPEDEDFRWTLVGQIGTRHRSIAVLGPTLFGAEPNMSMQCQDLLTASRDGWRSTGVDGAAVHSLAVCGNDFFGVKPDRGKDNPRQAGKVYRLVRSHGHLEGAQWRQAAFNGRKTAISIHDGVLYATGVETKPGGDPLVYQQDLETLGPGSKWYKAFPSNYGRSLAVYGCPPVALTVSTSPGSAGKVQRRELSDEEPQWVVEAPAGLTAPVIALTVGGVPGLPQRPAAMPRAPQPPEAPWGATQPTQWWSAPQEQTWAAQATWQGASPQAWQPQTAQWGAEGWATPEIPGNTWTAGSQSPCPAASAASPTPWAPAPPVVPAEPAPPLLAPAVSTTPQYVQPKPPPGRPPAPLQLSGAAEQAEHSTHSTLPDLPSSTVITAPSSPLASAAVPQAQWGQQQGESPPPPPPSPPPWPAQHTQQVQPSPVVQPAPVPGPPPMPAPLPGPPPVPAPLPGPPPVPAPSSPPPLSPSAAPPPPLQPQSWQHTPQWSAEPWGTQPTMSAGASSSWSCPSPSGSGSLASVSTRDPRQWALAPTQGLVKQDATSRRFRKAAKEGDVLSLETFLASRDVDVESRDGDGRTALYAAAGAGSASTLSLLLRSRADVNAPDRLGGMPLDEAEYWTAKEFAGNEAELSCARYEVLRLLQSAGAVRADLDTRPDRDQHISRWRKVVLRFAEVSALENIWLQGPLAPLGVPPVITRILQQEGRGCSQGLPRALPATGPPSNPASHEREVSLKPPPVPQASASLSSWASNVQTGTAKTGPTGRDIWGLGEALAPAKGIERSGANTATSLGTCAVPPAKAIPQPLPARPDADDTILV